MTDETHGFESFFENVARHKQNASVDYSEIKRAFDPFNIIPAGQPYPANSVEYFLLAWGEAINKYQQWLDWGDMDNSREVYDVIDWLTLLVGENHVDYYYHKMVAFDGFLMTDLANDIFLMYTSTNKTRRRWVATEAGCAALAIDLCHWRRRKGLDYKRINQHAMYMAHRASLVTGLKYNEAGRQAVRDFMDGTQLDVWESTVNDLDIEGGK